MRKIFRCSTKCLSLSFNALLWLFNKNYTNGFILYFILSVFFFFFFSLHVYRRRNKSDNAQWVRRRRLKPVWNAFVWKRIIQFLLLVTKTNAVYCESTNSITVVGFCQKAGLRCVVPFVCVAGLIQKMRSKVCLWESGSFVTSHWNMLFTWCERWFDPPFSVVWAPSLCSVRTNFSIECKHSQLDTRKNLSILRFMCLMLLQSQWLLWWNHRKTVGCCLSHSHTLSLVRNSICWSHWKLAKKHWNVSLQRELINILRK